jgi:hypothetical protein
MTIATGYRLSCNDPPDNGHGTLLPIAWLCRLLRSTGTAKPPTPGPNRQETIPSPGGQQRLCPAPLNPQHSNPHSTAEFFNRVRAPRGFLPLVS